MTSGKKFLLRAAASVFGALFISTFYFKNASSAKVAGLAAALLAVSYIIEFFRAGDPKR